MRIADITLIINVLISHKQTIYKTVEYSCRYCSRSKHWRFVCLVSPHHLRRYVFVTFVTNYTSKHSFWLMEGFLRY